MGPSAQGSSAPSLITSYEWYCLSPKRSLQDFIWFNGEEKRDLNFTKHLLYVPGILVTILSMISFNVHYFKDSLVILSLNMGKRGWEQVSQAKIS